MTGCSGAYESMAGKWWDACAVIDIGLDYTGTVTIWDEDYSRADPMSQATVTLNSAGVGEHGTVMVGERLLHESAVGACRLDR